MKLNKKQVLVTGATGFIGSHLVQRLIADGAKVVAMSHYRGDPTLHNLEFLSPDERAAITVKRGNIEDRSFVMSCVEGCDVVFHLAALISIPYSYVAPGSYVATNIGGTLNVLEASRACRTPRVVHTSTSECYGTAQFTPMHERHPLQGQSPYSASKIGADKLVESYWCSFELPVVTIRPFNTFGPRQSARAVISTIINQLVTAPQSPLRLGSTTPVRDLTFVTDTVAGFIAGATAEDALGEVINLGRGDGITIGELAQKIMRATGVETRIETEAQRVRPEKSEVRELISDNTKARQLLGWQPTVSLDEGLRQTIAFVRQHPHLFRAAEYGV